MANKNKLAEGLMRFGRQAKQGATFGFADELQDILAAVPAAAMTDMSYKEALKMARELSKEQLAKDWQKAPVTSFAGQAVGGLPLGLSKAGLAATNWIRGGSALQGIGKGAAVGAGLGGVSGLGAAGDTLGERLAGFGLGAGTGAVVGGATAPLARLGGGTDNVDFREVTKKTAKGVKNTAEKELIKQLSARPDLPEILTRAEGLKEASKRTGIQLTLPEMIAQSSSDPLLAQQSVLSTNPMTSGRMAQLYALRSGTPQQTGQIEQSLLNVAKQLDPNVGSYDEASRALIESAGEAQRGITRKLSAQAEPLYSAAYQKSIPENSSVLKNPLIQSALNKAKLNPVYAQEIGDTADNSIQALDVVKRSLDDMAEAAARQGNRNEARLIGNARTQLLNAMDEASPEYAQARQIYSGSPEALQMRGAIGGLADVDPMQAKSVNRALYGGTQQNAEVTAQALGEKAPTAAAARIYSAMDEARGDPVTLAKRIAPDQRTAEMLRAYGGEALDEPLSVIRQAQLGERTRYGSPTQPRMQAENVLADAASAAVDVKSGGATAILRKVAQAMGRGTPQDDPQFYADMADLLLTDKGMDVLRRAAQGQQTAIQELRTIGIPSTIVSGASSATRAMPVTTAAIGGMTTPSYQQQQISPQNGLPAGFVIRQQIMQELPAGFIIRQ